MNYRFFLRFFFLTIFVPVVTMAQEPLEKQTYAIVLDSLYLRTTLVYPKKSAYSKSDSLEQPVRSVRSLLVEPHYIYLDRYPVSQAELSPKRTYVDYFHSMQQGVHTSELKEFAENALDMPSCCYTLIANRDSLHYDQRKKCGALELPVRRYTFSRILYSKDKKTGFLTVRQQGNAGYQTLWLVLLQRHKTGWSIAQMTASTY